MICFAHFFVLQVAVNAVELSRVIQGRMPLEQTKSFAHSKDYVAVFQTYSKNFNDALALGAFELCSKTSLWVLIIFLTNVNTVSLRVYAQSVSSQIRKNEGVGVIAIHD